LPGADHLISAGDWESYAQALEEFLQEAWSAEARAEPETDRVLATILFTDIVGSTAKAVELGDARWRELLEDHHATVRRLLLRYRGNELDTAGDGFFAAFDGPARGIRCARAITESVRDLGIEVGAGLHTGECERALQPSQGLSPAGGLSLKTLGAT
jgi:class 3 adenylate cyclase